MLKDEIQAIYVMLGEQAGVDPVSDSNLRGRVQATINIINVEYDHIYGYGINND